MLKLLIVEDERWEREGLVDYLDWGALGIEIAGTARDGIEGMEQADHLVPDIVITDIKMPGMNGIEMSKRLKVKYPQIKIILLTGFDDFGYAREAIQFRANDYLLKPVEEQHLLQVMRKTADECRLDLSRSQETARLREQVMALMADERKQLWFDVLEGKASPEHLEGDPFRKNDHQYVVWAVKRGCGVLELPDMERKVDELPEKLDVLFAEGAEGDWLVLWSVAEEQVPLVERFAAQLTRRDGSYPGVSWIGIGNSSNSPSEFRESCRQARLACKFGEFWEVEGTAAYSETLAQQEHFVSIAHAVLNQANTLSRQMLQAVSGMDEGKAVRMLKELLDLLGSHRGASKDFICSYLNSLIYEISILVHDNTLYGNVAEERDMPGVRVHMTGYVGRAIAVMGEKRNDTEDYVVKKVIRMIEERYGSPDINLKTTAAALFLSPNYVGVMFKKSMGKSFNDYLTGWRMEKAKELLRIPGKKVSRVGEEVGIPNPSYFAVVFKSAVGMSPGEYQSINLMD
ncbi:response regulator [Cohnella sp.]|uniref:response regulator n=1 Tax=Cohnella sp. TaxID=1883426 RepID=UPI003562B6E4